MTVNESLITLGPMVSKGSVRLDTVLKDLGLIERAAGAVLGCTGAAVNNWRNGKRTPNRTWLTKIKNTWGIPVEWWFEPVNDTAQPAAGAA